MLSPQTGRHTGLAGLQPKQWGCIFELEDFYGQGDVGAALAANPLHRYNAVTVFITTNHNNRHNVRFVVEDSEDGTTWFTRYVPSDDLVPGGQMEFRANHVRRHVRLLGYSVGAALVHFELRQRVGDTNPKPIQRAPACTTFCESMCQTGAETYTEPE